MFYYATFIILLLQMREMSPILRVQVCSLLQWNIFFPWCHSSNLIYVLISLSVRVVLWQSHSPRYILFFSLCVLHKSQVNESVCKPYII